MAGLNRTDKKLLRIVHSITARRAVGASAVRGSRPGTAYACQEFLRKGVDLSKFGTSDSVAFNAALDRATTRLTAQLGSRKKWGLARKILNIFLRDCFYTCWLRDNYKLSKAAGLFELPLDSITAKDLRAKYKGPLTRSAGHEGWSTIGVRRAPRQRPQSYHRGQIVAVRRAAGLSDWYDARKVSGAASQALGVENLDAHFLRVRRTVGPLWDTDHKLVMAAAIVMARAFGK